MRRPLFARGSKGIAMAGKLLKGDSLDKTCQQRKEVRYLPGGDVNHNRNAYRNEEVVQLGEYVSIKQNSNKKGEVTAL